jgi:hypothetical protein
MIGEVLPTRSVVLIHSVSLFWSFRDLIRQLVLRDVTGRYKGSYLQGFLPRAFVVIPESAFYAGHLHIRVFSGDEGQMGSS